MAMKNRVTRGKTLTGHAEDWFDSTDDRLPFEAFPSEDQKVDIGEDMLSVIRQKIGRRRLYRLWFRSVAAAVVFLIAGTFGYRAHMASTLENVGSQWVSYVAKKGEFKKILLPDSSVVHLRPGATIAVAKPFFQGSRQVRLQQGEVFFEVSHDPKHPFLVNTGELTTKVLGTTFIINNDALSKAIRVVLLSGKIAVRDREKPLGTLSPKQQLFFDRANGAVTIDNNTTYAAESWLKGEYLLEDVTLKSFARTFGDAFSMEVRFAQQELENLPISIQFNLDDSPREILDQLKLVHRLHYEIKNREVVLMK